MTGPPAVDFIKVLHVAPLGQTVLLTDGLFDAAPDRLRAVLSRSDMFLTPHLGSWFTDSHTDMSDMILHGE